MEPPRSIIEDMTAATQVINCPQCGAANRVDPSRPGAVCGRCKSPIAAQVKPLVVTDGTFASEVEQSRLPVLVDFWAAWCGPCRMVAPILDKLASELSGRVRIAKLDVDANPMTSSRFRVQSIPTMIVFQNGREADRIVGAQSREAILQRLSRFM